MVQSFCFGGCDFGGAFRMSGRMDFPKLRLFLLLLGTRMPKDIRCGGGAKWEFREYFSDVFKGMIQIHERMFQLGWNEPLPTVVVFSRNFGTPLSQF